MHFKYRAKNAQGESVKGEIEATDQASASASLREQGLYVSSVAKVSEKKSAIPLLARKTGLKDKIIFTQQLGIMIKSGLAVVEALKALADETENKKFAVEINDVISDVKGGTTFSDALAKHPRSFDTVYCNTVKAGEKSGNLDEILAELAVSLEKDYNLTSKLRGAMIYPAVVLTALVAVLILVLVVIIPQLKLIFDDVGVPLPLITRIVIGISYFLQHYIIYIAIALVALIILVKYWLKTTSGRLIYDRARLKIPVLGTLFKKTYMAKFTRTFAGLTAAGLPLIDVFKTTESVIDNVIYQKAIDEMTKKVEVGEPTSKVIKDSPLFLGMVGQLASVGEKSGNIDVVFKSMADFFDKEVDNMTTNLSTLLEPVLMVVMGAGIGFLIIAVLQPIYGLVNAI
jgi:type IV pilus assembly protein PilC